MGLFIFWLILAAGVGFIASERGRSGAGWFFIAVIISPLLAVIGLLLVGRPTD